MVSLSCAAQQLWQAQAHRCACQCLQRKSRPAQGQRTVLAEAGHGGLRLAVLRLGHLPCLRHLQLHHLVHCDSHMLADWSQESIVLYSWTKCSSWLLIGLALYIAPEIRRPALTT